MADTTPTITLTEPASPSISKSTRGLRLAVIAGLLLWLSCPAVSFWPLAWMAIAPVIVGVIRADRLRQAVWRGYVFGWVYLGLTWYWTGLTIVAWTHSDIGWLAWFGLTLILALFYGGFGGFAWFLARRTAGWPRILAISAAWVTIEWMRTLGRLTMPWAQVSYTQYRCLPLIQMAEITGAYGVTFLVLMFNSALAEWWRNRADPSGPRRIAVCAGVVLLACLYGGVRLRSDEPGPVIRAAAMQPNFHVNSEADTTRDLSVIWQLTRMAAAHGDVSLYVWPESAAPTDAVHDFHSYQTLHDVAVQFNAGVTAGSRVIDPKTRSEYNSSVLFTADGKDPQRYDKQQLVPFGEFIPFREYLPAVLDTYFQFPPGDVSSGTGQSTLDFSIPNNIHVALGPFICYESMYPPYARRMTNLGANLLITQSNDDWFQSESALEQHLSAVVLRAVENRRCVVRSTTTGITCIIDTRGRITGQAPVGAPGFVVRSINLVTMRSIYTRCGDWFVYICILCIVEVGRRALSTRRRKPASNTPGKET